MLKPLLCLALLVAACGTVKNDNRAPTVTLTASSTSFSAPGTATLTAVASDDARLTKIDIYEGTTLLVTATSSPSTHTITISASSQRTFAAKAYDAAGHNTTSNAVTINADFSLDAAAPTAVTLSTSATSLLLGEELELGATATDNVGIAKIEFFDGTTKLGEDTSSPFTLSVAFSGAGVHSLTAKAFDFVGNNASSAATQVTALEHVLWHAHYYDHKIRGFSEHRWGATPTTTAANADTTIDVSACANAVPNGLVQDAAGNLIFTDEANNTANGRVVLIAASKFASAGTVTLTSGDCQVLHGNLTGAIGIALDGDGRSVFAAHATGVTYVKFNGTTYAAGVDLVTSGGASETFSGVLVDGDRLYVVNYGNFVATDTSLNVYGLNGARTTATRLLDISGTGQDYYVPEGIAIASGRVWVASNSGDNLLGVLISDLDAEIAAHPGTHQDLADWKLLYNNAPGFATLHCPGGLATDYLGNLWVNTQGASGVGADCGSAATPAGNVYKFTPAQLTFAAQSSNDQPVLQIEGLASVPGFGGLFFGR